MHPDRIYVGRLYETVGLEQMSIHESTGKVVSWDDLCKSDGFTLLGITRGFSQGGSTNPLKIWSNWEIKQSIPSLHNTKGNF